MGKPFERVCNEIDFYPSANIDADHVKKSVFYFLKSEYLNNEEFMLDDIEALILAHNPGKSLLDVAVAVYCMPHTASMIKRKAKIQLLIMYNKINIDDVKFRLNEKFVDACKHGTTHLVETLQNEPLVNPAFDDNKAIRNASAHGHISIVQMLLDDWRVDPADYQDYAITWASAEGHLVREFNRLILLQLRGLNYCFSQAVVKLLLSDNRVDPNGALALAAYEGHFEVVRTLLADSRVEPDSFDNAAIREACYSGKSLQVRHSTFLILLSTIHNTLW